MSQGNNKEGGRFDSEQMLRGSGAKRWLGGGRDGGGVAGNENKGMFDGRKDAAYRLPEGAGSVEVVTPGFLLFLLDDFFRLVNGSAPALIAEAHLGQ